MSRVRRRRCARTLAVAAGVAIAVAPLERESSAQEHGEPIRLEYMAAPGCPDEASFVGRVRARTSLAHMAWPGEVARGFAVRVEAGSPAEGTITVTNEHGTEGTRALTAATCEDVVDGLALILALAVDPHARTAATVGVTSPHESFSATAQTTVQSPPAPCPVVPPTLVAPPVPAASSLGDAAQSSASSSAPTHGEALVPGVLARRFFIGADFAFASGVTPSVLFAASPYLGVRALRAPALDLEIRASFFRVDSGATTVANGQADFTWTVGRVDGCAMLKAGPQLGVGPCARVEVGALDVVGTSAGETPQAQDTAWFAAGAMARIEWTLFGVFLLEGDAGLMGRITHDSFYFAPDLANAYAIGLAGVEAELGMGALFP